MIIDKEYPATHSMSTAWYIVDEDGNVGIMDVNDDGPSIVNYRETCLADLIFNAKYNEIQNKIDYTEEQILEILSPCEEIHDDIIPHDVVVKIHLSKKDRFFKLLDNPDIKLSFCISEKFGYYMIDASNYISRKAPTFSKILEEDLIKELFQLQHYFIDDINRENDGEITFENDFSSCPFYVYGSGFYNRHCQVRTSIPQHPMKLEQMPECFADEMVKVPLKFSERPTLQIAEYIPFHNYCSVLQSKCFKYHHMELNDGSWGYIMDHFDEEHPIPKIFHICGCNDMETCGFSALPFALENTLYISIMEDYGWKDNTKQKERIESFLEKKNILEYGIFLINPYLTIINDDILDTVSEFYTIQNGVATIEGHIFPIMLESELENNEQRIKEICELPYRGKKLPKVIRQTDLESRVS